MSFLIIQHIPTIYMIFLCSAEVNDSFLFLSDFLLKFADLIHNFVKFLLGLE